MCKKSVEVAVDYARSLACCIEYIAGQDENAQRVSEVQKSKKEREEDGGCVIEVPQRSEARGFVTRLERVGSGQLLDVFVLLTFFR